VPSRATGQALAALLLAGLALSGAAVADDAAPAPRAALTGPAGAPGLTVLYHEGDFGTVLDLDADQPATERTVATFALPDGIREDYFGLEYYGAIAVPAEGTYTFYTTSDDGSRLYIGETLVVQNDYPHGAAEQQGSISLKAGRHPIYVGYFDGVVDQVLEVRWSGPDTTKSAVPAEVLTQYPKVVHFPRDAVSTTELEWPDLGRHLTVTVDTRDAPELKAFHEVIPDVLRRHYPLMLSLLTAEGDTLPTQVTFSVRPGVDVPAYASGSRIVLSAEWFAGNPGDLGCLVHEFAHLVQSYPRSPDDAGWVVEGIADYVRYRVGADERWRIPDSYREGTHYTNGYGVTAAFLLYLERHYDAELVTKLNRALKSGTYRQALFEQYTGKPVDDLWEEYRQKSAGGVQATAPRRALPTPLARPLQADLSAAAGGEVWEGQTAAARCGRDTGRLARRPSAACPAAIS